MLLRAELERRELRAYSHGWRDAAAHFEPAVEAARTANLRTLRLVGRTPGRAAVIPFRHEDRAGEPRDAEHGDGLPGDADRPHADRHAEGPRGESRPEKAEPRRDRPHADRRSGPLTGPPRPARTGPEPALVPKSRNSRVPTIPTLPAPRLRLPPQAADGGRQGRHPGRQDQLRGACGCGGSRYPRSFPRAADGRRPRRVGVDGICFDPGP